MYIKKRDRELFQEIDNNLLMPVKWKQFIDKVKVKHRLIIKSKKKYKCGNCNSEFNSNLKVNDQCKCPNCKNTYLIKSCKLSSYILSDNVGVVQKYNDYFILRHFEIKTYFSTSKGYHSHICEYGRQIFDDKFIKQYDIMNDNITSGIGCFSINHKYNYNSNWHYIGSYYKNLGDTLIIYPYNLKNLLKGTKWQYSMIWKLAEKMDYITIEYLLKNYCNSLELLIKLGFYKLAECPKTFNKKGNFEERFGVPKEYAKFIKRHNLDIDELKILSYSRIKDIRLIKKINKYKFEIELLSQYNVDLQVLLKSTDIKRDNTYEYYDYLKFVKALGLDLKDKSIKYPSNIKEDHDKYLKQYEVKKNKLIDNKIKKRYKELKNNTFSDKNFFIRPAKSFNDMQNESEQMINCVRSYAEDYANHECDIYFMRCINSQNISLVTVEVNNNKIIQKRTKKNEVTSKLQDKFLNKFEKYINRNKKRKIVEE